MNVESSSRNAEGLLTLLQLRGVGALTALRLAKRFSDIAELAGAPAQSLRGLATTPIISQLQDRTVMRAARERALGQISQTAELGIRILSYFSDEYPASLQRISDPPAVLFVKGNLRPELPRVACVGTRKPTEFGTNAARNISSMLAQNGYSIVSGLAIGIDGECHRAALDVAGHTIAVLGNGLDTVQPAKHRQLAERILEQGGALVSEQPLGAKALARNLIQSVRLQSALSVATFVMQTDIDGGTIHTVRSTLEQRRLLVVPVPPPELEHEPANQGILVLARQSGPELARTLEANGNLRNVLEREFAGRRAAEVIDLEASLDSVLDQLHQAADAPR